MSVTDKGEQKILLVQLLLLPNTNDRFYVGKTEYSHSVGARGYQCPLLREVASFVLCYDMFLELAWL